MQHKGTGERSAVKLIRHNRSRSVHVDRNTVDLLIRNPRPEVYWDVWDDPEGVVVRMHEYPSTLRDFIIRDQPWHQKHWLLVMGGVSMRLELAHQAGYVHGDLKPSNGALRKLLLLTS